MIVMTTVNQCLQMYSVRGVDDIAYFLVTAAEEIQPVFNANVFYT